jgi:hypothetical protein
MTDTHDTKVCTKCGVDKPLEEYGKQRNGKKSWCKPCENLRTKIWYEQNKDRRNAIARAWAKNNKDKVNAAKRLRRSKIRELNPLPEKPKFDKYVWLKNNKHRLAKYRRDWLNADPKNIVSDRVRRRINGAFTAYGYKKTSRTAEIIGCSCEELKLHIESKFQLGMTWENRDQWHIDHIIPLATAKTEEDVIRLNHYTNLQPLWAADNLRKSDKLDF